MRFLVQFALLLGLVFGFCSPAAWSEPFRLFILHTNDIHGHIEAEEDRGLTRIATYVRALRAAFPNQVLLVDSGDIGLGTPISGLYFGIPTVEIMRGLEYDAVALCNHEFNWGMERLRALTDTLPCPVLCANLVSADQDFHGPYPGWTVLEKSGLRIGLIGLVAPDTALRSPRAATQGWRFIDPSIAARQALAEMPEADLVIALTHLGVQADKVLAQEVPDIQVIVGGHSHTALEAPVMVGSTAIVQAGCYAQFLGFLELEVEPKLKRVQIRQYRLLPVDESLPPDPQAQAVVDQYQVLVGPILDEVLTEVENPIGKATPWNNPYSPLATLVAEALRLQSGADLALFNRGGVRSELSAGPLTVRTAHRIMPFDDPVVTISVDGQHLLEILKEGLFNNRAFLALAGVQAEIDYQNQSLENVRIQGIPINPRQRYLVALTSFLVGGGDGMSTLRGTTPISTLPYVRELFMDYCRSQPVLREPDSPDLKTSQTNEDGVPKVLADEGETLCTRR